MTYLAIETDNTLLARFAAWVFRLFKAKRVYMSAETTDLRLHYIGDDAPGFGAWADDPRSDEAIINDIRASRHTNHNKNYTF
jgi:hypothetical protein